MARNKIDIPPPYEAIRKENKENVEVMISHMLGFSSSKYSYGKLNG